MKNLYRWMLIIPVLFLISCSPKTAGNTSQEKLNKITDEELIAALVAMQESYPEYFYAKMESKFQNSKNNYSFKTSLKITKDSAINALITYAKIPIITANIDRDTVKIINRRDKCFVIQDINFIKANFGVNFDYKNIQELIMGKPIDFDQKDTYFILQDSKYYVVSSHNRRAIKDENDETAFIINYYLNRDLKSLAKIELFTADKSTYVTVDIPEHQEVEGQIYPKVLKMNIKAPKEKTNVTLIYEKIEVNEPRDMLVIIPENYVSCQ